MVANQPEITSKSTPKPASRRFVLLVAIATAAAAIAGVAGFTIWKDGNRPSIDGLSDKLMVSMNESLSQDKDFEKVGLRVKSATVMRAVGNVLEGQATAATNTGSDHDVIVHITYDGDTLLWHTDPGSFAFVAKEQFESR